MQKLEYSILNSEVAIIKINNQSFSLEEADIVDLLELLVAAAAAMNRAKDNKYNTEFLGAEDWN